MITTLDIEVHDLSTNPQAKYLVHGHDDVFWTDDIDEALDCLRQSLLELGKDDTPANYIPAGATIITGYDESNGDDYGCTVRGFYKDGVFHIQEIEYHE